MNKNDHPTYQLYGALNDAYDYFNHHLFDGKLPNCLLTLQRQPKMMGYAFHERWVNQEKQFVDELAINPDYFIGGSILEVFQTLVHEQCHIWQYHQGKPSRRKYHNAEWADKMESIGLIPSHTGSPGGKRTGEHMADYVIDDGLFLKAARQLLKNGFGLPWLDRRGIYHKASHMIFSRSGKLVKLDSSCKSLVARLGEKESIETSKAEMPYQLKPTHNQLTHSKFEQASVNPIQFATPTKKATRVKYRCEACYTQVWGKPNLKIICGSCERPYVLVNDSMESEPWQQTVKSNGLNKPGIQ